MNIRFFTRPLCPVWGGSRRKNMALICQHITCLADDLSAAPFHKAGVSSILFHLPALFMDAFCCRESFRNHSFRKCDAQTSSQSTSGLAALAKEEPHAASQKWWSIQHPWHQKSLTRQHMHFLDSMQKSIDTRSLNENQEMTANQPHVRRA